MSSKNKYKHIKAMGMNYGFSAQFGRNAGYCLLGAKLTSRPLTEIPLHAKHPSHVSEIIWMPLGAGGSEIGTRLSEAKVIFRQIGEVLAAFHLAHPK